MNSSPHLSRRFVGPLATEVFALCRPDPSQGEEVATQTRHVHETMQQILHAEGGSLKHVVREWVYFRGIRWAMEPFLRARCRLAGKLHGSAFYLPASVFTEHPPLNPRLQLELAFHAVIPRRKQRAQPERLEVKKPCNCSECSPPGVRMMQLGDMLHVHAGNIYGTTGNAYREAYSMYQAADELLRQAGMNFHNVVRTWICLRDIGRDYAEFNRARRDFYKRSGITLFPASTGIGGGCHASTHDFLMGLYAIQSPSRPEVAVMTTPTLNEAAAYGSEFSRGLRVVDGNKVTLLISGTASVDANGHTAHVGDLHGQLDRMLLNVSSLLTGQQASFRHLVSLTTYLKDQAGTAYLLDMLHHRGLDGLPNALVEAAVCREDLLCEMEAIAVLPLPQ
jgi:enamine deaminase RidA (YjgF/YER057c/UK114 family)